MSERPKLEVVHDANDAPSFATTMPPGHFAELVKYGMTLGSRHVVGTALVGSFAVVSLAAKTRFMADVIPPHQTSLVVFMLALGGTGIGKETLRKMLRWASETGLSIELVSDITSASALHEALSTSKDGALGMLKDEWPTWLESVGKNQHLPGLLGMFLELYSIGTGTYFGQVNRGKNKRIQPVKAPFFTQIGGAQPKRLSELLTPALMHNGLMNRLTIVPCVSGARLTFSQRRETQFEEQRQTRIEAALLEIERGAAKVNPEDNEVVEVMTAVMFVSDENSAVAERLEAEFDLMAERSKFPELWQRAAEQMVKIAAIVSLFNAAYEAVNVRKARLTESDLEIARYSLDYASAFVRTSIQTLERLAHDSFGDNPLITRAVNYVKKVTDESNGNTKWVTVADVRAKMRRYSNGPDRKQIETNEQLETAIKEAVDLGLLVFSEKVQGVKRASKYGYVRLP